MSHHKILPASQVPKINKHKNIYYGKTLNENNCEWQWYTLTVSLKQRFTGLQKVINTSEPTQPSVLISATNEDMDMIASQRESFLLTTLGDQLLAFTCCWKSVKETDLLTATHVLTSSLDVHKTFVTSFDMVKCLLTVFMPIIHFYDTVVTLFCQLFLAICN